MSLCRSYVTIPWLTLWLYRTPRIEESASTPLPRSLWRRGSGSRWSGRPRWTGGGPGLGTKKPEALCCPGKQNEIVKKIGLVGCDGALRQRGAPLNSATRRIGNCSWPGGDCTIPSEVWKQNFDHVESLIWSILYSLWRGIQCSVLGVKLPQDGKIKGWTELLGAWNLPLLLRTRI